MKPTLTPEQRAHVQAIYKSLPPSWRQVGEECEKAIDFLMEKKGYSFEKSQDCVIEILKECAPYLRGGMVKTCILTIRSTFSDDPNLIGKMSGKELLKYV